MIHRNYVQWLAIHTGAAKPNYRLTAPPKTQFSTLQRGDTTLLGVVLLEDAAGNNRVAWNDLSHVYDVRAGQYLGETNEIVIDASQRVHLFALEKSPILAVQI